MIYGGPFLVVVSAMFDNSVSMMIESEQFSFGMSNNDSRPMHLNF